VEEADFLWNLSAAVPYKVHTVLTDNGTHFTEPTGDGWTPADIKAMRTANVPFRCHSFEAACADRACDVIEADVFMAGGRAVLAHSQPRRSGGDASTSGTLS
jgi:hypothetical protein